MDQLVHPTLLQSIAFRLWQIYLPKIVRQCGQLSSSPPGNAVHLWWAMMIGWVIWVMKVNQNVKKVPLIIKKWKTHFYITFNFWWLAKWSKQQKSSHEKMQYSFLYYTQLLIVRQVIWVMKVDQNAKKWNVASVRVLCCFSLGLLLFLSGSCVHPTFFCYFSLGLLYPPPPPDGKVGIRVAEKFKFFRFMFNKFQPKDNSVQSLLHLLAMQLICDGQWTNWFTLHFYNLSIQVMANLST